MQLRASGARLSERIYIPQHPRAYGKRIGIDSSHPSNGSGRCEVDSLTEPACTGASVPDVGYFCDTQGGSSGSPVLAYSDRCVVALHHCANCENRGVPIQSVISHLGNQLPPSALCGRPVAAANLTIDETIRTRSLSGFSNPAIVLGPPSFVGVQPATTRLQNVSSGRFQFFLDEWDYLDGPHANESIGFLAVETGATSIGSLAARAGRTQGNHEWKTVNFGTTLPAVPVVVTQVGTFNGNQACTTRVRNVTTSGFQVRLQEEEAGDGTHVNETIHWIAVVPGSTTVDGRPVRVGRTGNAVTEAWHTVGYGASMSGAVVVAEMQTFDGANPAALRHQGRTGSQVQVKVEEEASLDAEIGHTSEVVGWIVIGN